MIRVQCVVSECLQCIPVKQLAEIFVIDSFDLLDLVRCSETVKEVHERNS